MLRRPSGGLLRRGDGAITLYVTIASRYHVLVIRTWADVEAEKLFNRQRTRRLPSDIQRVALRKLLMLDAATTLEDLRVPPANRLEKLKGDREGQWSIRINDQWRVCFTWRDSNAYEVEIVDYH
jgi:proteic killer suppression protein